MYIEDDEYNYRKNITSSLKIIFIIIILKIFIEGFLFTSRSINGESMMPSLNHRDRVVVSIGPYMFYLKEFNRGDIIVFKPLDKDSLYIKRIIGLPGDDVLIENGRVYVNGEILEEKYIEENIYTESLNKNRTVLVKEDEFFVLGDNRKHFKSKDSRIMGNIPRESVLGKAEFRLSPFKDRGRF